MSQAALATYNDRPLVVAFLQTAFVSESMILRDYLLVMLTCNEIIACTRGRAVVHDKFSAAYEFLSASSTLDGWSCTDMAQVVDMTRVALRAGFADPSVWLDEDYDPYAALVGTVPEYAEWRAVQLETDAYAIDGTTLIKVTKTVRAELYRPTDRSNIQSTARAREHVKAFLGGMLRTLENSAVATRYVDIGDMSVRMQTAEMLKAFKDTWRNANKIEGLFGHEKMYGLWFRCSASHTNGVVVCARDRLFPKIAHKYVVSSGQRKADGDVRSSWLTKRKRDEKDDAGRLGEIDEKVVGMICDVARATGKREHAEEARARAAAAAAHSLARREERETKAEEKTVDLYVKAKQKIQITPIISDDDVKSKTLMDLTRQIDAYLAKVSDDKRRASALKDTLERYVIGMYLRDLKPKHYTSEKDEVIGKAGSSTNVAWLRSALLKAMSTIKEKELTLVAVASAPAVFRRQLPTMGEPTFQRAELESAQLADSERLDAMVAAREQAPRPSSTRPRPELPTIGKDIINRPIEVVWELTYKVRGADGRVTDHVANFRCPGVIKRISAPDTKDGRRKLGVGHVYIHYDDKTKGWLQANRPTFYNNMSKAGGWRLVGPDVRMDDDDDDDDDDDGAIDGEVFDADDDADDEESDDDDDDDAGGV